MRRRSGDPVVDVQQLLNTKAPEVAGGFSFKLHLAVIPAVWARQPDRSEGVERRQASDATANMYMLPGVLLRAFGRMRPRIACSVLRARRKRLAIASTCPPIGSTVLGARLIPRPIGCTVHTARLIRSQIAFIRP